jgi:hypothetical protein
MYLEPLQDGDVSVMIVNIPELKNTVGFGVLTAVATKNSILMDITLCSPLKVNPSFGGTSRLHLQGRRIRQAIISMT